MTMTTKPSILACVSLLVASTGACADASGDPSDEAAAVSGAIAASRCTATTERVTCVYDTTRLSPAWGADRDVHFQVPIGAPPPNGFPTVLLFQGSLFGARISFDADEHLPFG